MKVVCSRFPKGASGNPKGRPKGSRNKSTVAAETLLDGEAEKLTRKCVELALEGDTVALRLCLERILPPRKTRALSVSFPEIRVADDILPAVKAVAAAVSRSEVTPDEGEALMRMVDAARRALETEELHRLAYNEAFDAAGLTIDGEPVSMASEQPVDPDDPRQKAPARLPRVD